jgi:hypothetical protein
LNISTYEVWRYVHILLFVYWLGADLGVYYAAKYVARADLSMDERMRFLDLTLLLDMGPRTGLVLMFPAGLQLSAMAGLARTPQPMVWAAWIGFVAWLALVWVQHGLLAKPLGETLRRVDLSIRYLVIALMLGLGGWSLYRGTPFITDWLALKVLLYGCVIAAGVYLRSIIAAWGTGFKLYADGQQRQANQLIAAAQRKGEYGANVLWLLVAAIAFLGVAKPF